MLSTEHNKLERRFYVRWRFEYLDGKPPKYGMWSRPADKNDTANQAWCHNKNVARAIIEGKDIRTKEVVSLVECRGDDFINFQWNAVARLNLGSNIGREYTPLTKLSGLKLVTRYKVFDVYETGEVVESVREEDHYNYATFGR